MLVEFPQVAARHARQYFLAAADGDGLDLVRSPVLWPLENQQDLTPWPDEIMRPPRQVVEQILLTEQICPSDNDLSLKWDDSVIGLHGLQDRHAHVKPLGRLMPLVPQRVGRTLGADGHVNVLSESRQGERRHAGLDTVDLTYVHGLAQTYSSDNFHVCGMIGERGERACDRDIQTAVLHWANLRRSRRVRQCVEDPLHAR